MVKFSRALAFEMVLVVGLLAASDEDEGVNVDERRDGGMCAFVGMRRRWVV